MSYIEILDILCKRLQDDYNGLDIFEQCEEDRLAVYSTIEILETLREYIKFELSTYPSNQTLENFLKIIDGECLGMTWEEIRDGNYE